MIYGKCSSRQRPHDTTPSNRTPGFVRKHQAPCRPLPIEPEDGGEIARTDPTVDATDGTQVSQSTVLTSAEKTIVATFRQKTLLPRDDVLDCSFNTLPTSVAVRYTVACHAMASPRLPIEETRERHKQFKFYEISYVHIDRCEFRHAESQLVIFLAISRVSKFTMSSSTNAREKWRGGGNLPSRHGGGFALPNPHRADRQRHGFCRPAQEPPRLEPSLPRPEHLQPRLYRKQHRAPHPSPSADERARWHFSVASQESLPATRAINSVCRMRLSRQQTRLASKSPLHISATWIGCREPRQDKLR